MSTKARSQNSGDRIQNGRWSTFCILTSGFCLPRRLFDKARFLQYSYKGLASCVFCSRATAL